MMLSMHLWAFRDTVAIYRIPAAETFCLSIYPPQPAVPTLRQHIPAINYRIAPRLITRRITRQVQEQAFDLSHIALPAHDRHAIRFTQALGRSAHFRFEEARRHDIDAGEVAPLAREGFAQMVDGSLGCVVDLERALDWWIGVGAGRGRALRADRRAH